ncbi:MAG: hypothetical protein NZ695_00150 [Dehalococcoidia bacterium]|nr:hypothetical protein [Dehalococcoidia bacterium]MDW8008207.1 hypothetical protein [Chloroflexota bacterium]
MDTRLSRWQRRRRLSPAPGRRRVSMKEWASALLTWAGAIVN